MLPFLLPPDIKELLKFFIYLLNFSFRNNLTIFQLPDEQFFHSSYILSSRKIWSKTIQSNRLYETDSILFADNINYLQKLRIVIYSCHHTNSNFKLKFFVCFCWFASALSPQKSFFRDHNGKKAIKHFSCYSCHRTPYTFFIFYFAWQFSF